jgi:hypothetical protein
MLHTYPLFLPGVIKDSEANGQASGFATWPFMLTDTYFPLCLSLHTAQSEELSFAGQYIQVVSIPAQR